MDLIDKQIIITMQDEFPLVPNPYAVLAEKIGISEEELFCRLKAMRESGKIRKFGAVLTHRQIGYTANALCAWEVPETCCNKVGSVMASYPLVTHCYFRRPQPDWPYNFYTMIHGHSSKDCETIAQKLSEITGIERYRLLFSTKEWKKTSMRYFLEHQDAAYQSKRVEKRSFIGK